jgi:proteic killer suppression protein
MIKCFKSDLTESIWNRKKTKGLPGDIFKVARRKLGFLEDAITLNVLRIPPGNRLDALNGEREGLHSI